jgi:hypothetical protein
MSLRAWTWTVVVLAAVVLVACDNDGTDASEKAVTTTAEPGATTQVPLGSTSTTTPKDFETETAKLQNALDAAEGDLCQLMDVTDQPLYVVPEDEEQAHIVVDLIVDMVESMGRVAEPGDAKYYAEAADRLRDEAEAKDYEPSWLTGPETFKALDDKEFFEASGRLQARYQQQCPQAG